MAGLRRPDTASNIAEDYYPDLKTRVTEFMEGAASPEGNSPSSASANDAAPLTSEWDLGPAYAVLSALAGDRIPRGPLGPDNVPAKVLAIPIRRAMQALGAHRGHCKQPRCPKVPAPLWQYQTWSDKAISGLGDQIHKVLWAHLDHEFIEAIRKRIVAEDAALAASLIEGTLLAGGKLEEFLRTAGEDGPRRLAALLWAVGLDVPTRETLFRILVPLIDDRGTARAVEPPGNGQRQARDRQVRDAHRQRKAAEQSAQKARDDLGATTKALTKVREELEDLKRKYATASEEIEAVEARARETEISLHITERNAESASKSNAALRNDLRETREAAKALEVRRSDLARQLAFERLYLEQFKQSHKTGATAVWEFLQKEEERIRIDQTIYSGGRRQEADREWTAHRKFREAFLGAYKEYVEDRPPQKLLPKTTMRLTALGGSDEVGRSCYLLELGKRRIMVDCGIKPGALNDHPDLSGLDGIDALLLTHAHTDHIGWIPALVKKFGDIDIYCSEATTALLPVMLEDCRRHYVRKITSAQDRARHVRNAQVVPEEYEDADVRHVANLVMTCPFGQQIGLPFGGVTVQFFQAGHILGAASILIEDQTGRRAFFSGDFSSFSQLTVPAASWPEDLGAVDLLVLESTYGGKPQHLPLEDSRRELITLIRDTVEKRNGSIVLASFALGRAQELLSLIALARQNGEIPESVPIHIDGMINRINPVYQDLANDFSVQRKGFFEVSGSAERRDVLHDAQTKPTIIVTTSGMMNGGPVVEYAKQLLPDDRNRIVFSGYQDEGAPSRALMDLERPGSRRVVELMDEHGETVRIEAAVPAKHVGLSAHADQAGLVDYASRLEPKVIALVHGDVAAQEKLRTRLADIHEGAEIVCSPSVLPII